MLLNCHTFFSFRYGTFAIDELLHLARYNGYRACVLSDINNTSAVIEALRMVQNENKNLPPEAAFTVIPGIDFRNGIAQCFVGIARNNAGFKELNQYLSEHLHARAAIAPIAPAFENAYVVYPYSVYRGWPLRENEFVGLTPQDVPRFDFAPKGLAHHKLVVLHTATFQDKEGFNAHRLLRAVDQNCLLSKLPLHQQGSLYETMLPKEALDELYRPFPEAQANTNMILQGCNVDLGFGKFANKNRRHYTGSVTEDIAKLRHESYAGLNYRYGANASPQVIERLEKELEIIEQMHFSSYFLINWDIIQYARKQGYYYVGRGSGANSIVAYLLRITDVDPIELDLYFERFINPARSNPPDFDIDFSWTDRDDITRYIFDTFGHQNTALVGTYNTFQHAALVRELGKVFGLPPAEIERLQKINDPALAGDEFGRLILKYSRYLADFPNHLSIHASGIIISEEPVTAYTATELPPKGYPTTQFSMLEAEDIGLYKFDILSQRGLGKIKDTLHIVKENHGIDIDIHDVKRFINDDKVKNLLREGNTMGCFYVESPAMRMLLRKLQADDYLRLVAASSIIRPGVAKSGMMREYILRYRNEDLRKKAQQAIPELYALLEETYGVMVYQEDVIKIAHLFAGLSLAEADYLRRGMSWKFKQRSEFALVREKFFTNCRAKNYAEQTILNTWNQIESFAHFAFSKGHSASYAVESYQALYLKAHYPREYMVATLNNGGGFYRTELYLHEAMLQGAIIEPPCINNSGMLCRIQDKTIYLGLSMVTGLEQHTIEALLRDRAANGPFTGLENFVKRVPLSIEQVRILIRSGAFSFSGKKRKELLWQVHMLINPLRKNKFSHDLFEVEHKTYALPQFYETGYDDAFDELELLGFTLCLPFSLLRNGVPHTLKARALHKYNGQTVSMTGYLVNIKKTPTAGGEAMYFGTFTDTEGHWIDTVHFPPSAKKHPFKGPGCYNLTGTVVEEFDFITLEISHMERLETINRDDGQLAPAETLTLQNT